MWKLLVFLFGLLSLTKILRITYQLFPVVLKTNNITYWESIDSSQMVLSIIRHGYYLPLTEDLACVNFKSP